MLISDMADVETGTYALREYHSPSIGRPLRVVVNVNGQPKQGEASAGTPEGLFAALVDATELCGVTGYVRSRAREDGLEEAMCLLCYHGQMVWGTAIGPMSFPAMAEAFIEAANKLQL